IKKSPKHKGTRKTLQKAAGVLSSKNELMSYLHKHHKLPQGELCRLVGITPRVLEKGRTYVIALALLLSGDEFPPLKSYVKILTEERGESS
ncbi:MAG: RNA polymerase sigma-I factor, partial [Candidatus Contubernalis sp.]|nr:RNA polymerase sigma-I factor [Candidatus Contubernalis sp.]